VALQRAVLGTEMRLQRAHNSLDVATNQVIVVLFLFLPAFMTMTAVADGLEHVGTQSMVIHELEAMFYRLQLSAHQIQYQYQYSRSMWERRLLAEQLRYLGRRIRTVEFKLRVIRERNLSALDLETPYLQPSMGRSRVCDVARNRSPPPVFFPLALYPSQV
jgi:hypothetical protein